MRLPRASPGDRLEVQKGSTVIDLYTQAHHVASNSPDPSTKVGAIVYSSGQVIAVGWNHFPLGVPEEWWEDRERKYQAVIHAEVAAITRAGLLACGSTLVVTHHPCKECAKVIAAAGIRCVVCPPGPWRDDPGVVETVTKARELMDLCGIEVIEARMTQ